MVNREWVPTFWASIADCRLPIAEEDLRIL